MIPNVKENELLWVLTAIVHLLANTIVVYSAYISTVLLVAPPPPIAHEVKVFIETRASPYRLSLHTSHDILPDKCLMKCLKTKVNCFELW